MTKSITALVTLTPLAARNASGDDGRGPFRTLPTTRPREGSSDNIRKVVRVATSSSGSSVPAFRIDAGEWTPGSRGDRIHVSVVNSRMSLARTSLIARKARSGVARIRMRCFSRNCTPA